MAGYCSTGQSPQQAVALMEEGSVTVYIFYFVLIMTPVGMNQVKINLMFIAEGKEMCFYNAVCSAGLCLHYIIS
jgi:hypothetical protein